MSFDYFPISPCFHTVSALLAALLLDHLLGEPRRWHPLAGFGWLACRLETCLNRHLQQPFSRLMGLLAWLLLLTPLVALSYAATHNPVAPAYGWLVDTTLLYFAIGARSLSQHAIAVYGPLKNQDIAAARHAVGMIVSRDPQQANAQEIAAAAVESVLENGNDAVFGAIFWFVVLGGTGALAFRLANTLDAMWGYRTPRFLYFGWAAARLDDVLNLIPARLTALSYALCGKTITALKCWRQQASQWYSPNAGPVMAAGAGALQLSLGGPATYHGKRKSRPILGIGRPAQATDILRAIRLMYRSLLLWCGVIAITCLFLEWLHA